MRSAALQEHRGGPQDGLRAAMDRWMKELAPGARGFLGSTAGVAEDGTFLATAQFDSEENARRNSDRPEQGAWWHESAQNLEGEARFSDYANVELFGEGGSDQAGFVQVIRGRSTDIDQVMKLGREMDADLRRERPEVIGGAVGWTRDGEFTDVLYFTSEQEAREGERKRTPAFEQYLEAYQRLTQDVRFIDLRETWLMSP